MRRLRLIHWNPAEARPKAARLRALGYVVDAKAFHPGSLRGLRQKPPSVVVIDLGRMPSQGRDVGLALRTAKATRHLPLVFVEGDREKVARTRKLLPDAVYTTWPRIATALERAIARPPAQPAVPASNLAGYSGTPLPRKLGIKPDSVVALIGAPPGFEKTLGALPDGARLDRHSRGRPDLVIWFAKSRRELEGRIVRIGALFGAGGLWIAWPKQASGVPTDLTGNIVRGVGLDSGLVDYKVAAIDETWAGLKFARRKR